MKWGEYVEVRTGRRANGISRLKVIQDELPMLDNERRSYFTNQESILVRSGFIAINFNSV